MICVKDEKGWAIREGCNEYTGRAQERDVLLVYFGARHLAQETSPFTFGAECDEDVACDYGIACNECNRYSILHDVNRYIVPGYGIFDTLWEAWDCVIDEVSCGVAFYLEVEP